MIGLVSVRLRFVFGASSKAGIGPVCVRDGFRPRLGAGFEEHWTPLLTCLSWALPSTRRHAALILLDPDFVGRRRLASQA